MIIQLIKDCWKGVLTVVVVLSTITALTTFYLNLVTQSELEAAETRIQKSIELRDNIYQLNNINENITRVRVFLATHPTHKEMLKELEELKTQKLILKKIIEGNKR